MPEQDLTHLSPTSAAGDEADHNGVDSFPRLVETPATMSPVPSNDRNQPPSATLLQQNQTKLANGEMYGPQDSVEREEDVDDGADEEEDSSWSSDSDGEDELSTLRAIASSGTDPIDSRSIYQALFGGGVGGGMGKGGGIGAAGPPQRSLAAQGPRKLPKLPVYKLALGRADIDSCVKLEEACFPEGGASRDDITYRIAKASGLNIGLFTTAYPQSESAKLPTYATSSSSETTSNRRIVLVAYINATLTTNDRILKEDIITPKNWQNASSKADEKLGHVSYGRTVVVHSFGVLPELQRQNLGTCLWKTFMQMVKGSKHYTRIAIAVPTTQVAWFKKHKFRTLGSSALDAGPDAPKVDMVIDYHEDDDSDDDEDEEGEEQDLGAIYGNDPVSSDEEEEDSSEAAEDQLMQES